MRYLLYFTLGTVFALALCIYILGPFPMGAAASVFLLAGFWSLAGKSRKAKMAMVLSAGSLFGFLWFSAYGLIFHNQQYAGQTVPLTVTLTEAARPGRFGSHAEGVTYLEGRPCRVFVLFRDQEDLQSGDSVRGEFRLQSDTFGRKSVIGNRAGADMPLRAYPQGEIRRIHTDSPVWWTWPGRFRTYSESVISWCFSEKAAPFAQALLLGNTENLPFSVKWDLRTSGISHLVAVSGLHVGILCMLVSLLFLHNPWLTLIFGTPVLLFFSAVTGFTPSVVRAVCMMELLLLSRCLRKRYDPLTELSAAVLAMVTFHPFTVASVSFQLSCASVLGIFCFYKKIRKRLSRYLPKGGKKKARILHGMVDSAAISLSSLIFVAPLSLAYFGSISLIAVFTNLLTVWLVPLIFWGILLVLAISWVSIGAAGFLGTVLSWPIVGILTISHFLARIPGAAIYGENPLILLWVGCAYASALFYFRKQDRDPAKFLKTAAGTLCMVLILSWSLFRVPGLTMKVYDVGQGQCILLQTGGKTFLVDCGGEREEASATMVLNTLKTRGIRRLSGIILTHFDRDHICALDEVLSVTQTEKIYIPEAEERPFDPRIRVIQNEQTISAGASKITIYGSESQASSNEKGLCVLLDSPEYDILITGDRSREGELGLLENHRIPPVDCLIAGHHGAADSTSPELLQAVCPRTVIVSAGRNNRYGHPAAETLLRLQKFHCQVLRTDLQGTITIRR